MRDGEDGGEKRRGDRKRADSDKGAHSSDNDVKERDEVGSDSVEFGVSLLSRLLRRVDLACEVGQPSPPREEDGAYCVCWRARIAAS